MTSPPSRDLSQASTLLYLTLEGSLSQTQDSHMASAFPTERAILIKLLSKYLEINYIHILSLMLLMMVTFFLLELIMLTQLRKKKT